MNIFKLPDYRSLLTSWINSQSERGARVKLAQAAHCSPSWLTRVLSEEVHLTPDQAMGIAEHLHLTDEETEYFLLMVDFERSATPALKRRLKKKMDRLLSDSRLLKTSMRSEASIPSEFSTRYYSSWTYAAIHVACMIKPQSLSDISNQLFLPASTVSNTIKELRKMGLIQIIDGAFLATSKSLHLPSDHPAVNSSHAMWRSRTIQHLQEGHTNGLHYSAIHCLSKKDIEVVHDQLKSSILKSRSIISESPSEALAVFCVDWFSLPT